MDTDFPSGIAPEPTQIFEPAPTPSGGEQEPTSVFIAGQQVPISEIEALYQKRENLEAGYTRKFKSLAQEREYVERYKPFLSYLEQDRELQAYIEQYGQWRQQMAAYQQQQAPQGYPQPQVDPELYGQLEAMQSKLNAMEEHAVIKEIEGQVAKLAAKAGPSWTPEAETKVLTIAAQHGLGDLEVAYKIYLADNMDAIKTGARNQVLGEIRNNRYAGVLPGAGPSGPQALIPNKPLSKQSWGQVVSQAKQRLGI
jgi:hypothetical protein